MLTLVMCRRLFYNQFSERIFQDSSIVERLHAGIKTWLEWERKERLLSVSPHPSTYS